MLGDLTRGPLRRIGTYHKENDVMEDDEPPEGVMWRTVVTVAAFLVWLVWLLLWWAFWSGDLTIAQRFAVSIVSILVLGATLAAVWLPFSMRHGDEGERWSVPGFRWRVICLLPLARDLYPLGPAADAYRPDHALVPELPEHVANHVPTDTWTLPFYIGNGKGTGPATHS